MSRSQRRHDRDRMVIRAKWLYPHTAVPQKYADNRTVCSRYCCGNPRHHLKGRDRVTKHEIEINDYECEDPYHETVWEKSICEEVFPEEVD